MLSIIFDALPKLRFSGELFGMTRELKSMQNDYVLMDIYTLLFALSTLWVGPFWFAMMLKPYDAKTSEMMDKPWVFAGPICIWFAIMILHPEGLIDFAKSGSHPDGFMAGLAAGMSSKAGVTAMWSHMVAGDILATRWIWKDSIRRQNSPWVIRLCVFFGVMLMPFGFLFHFIFRKRSASVG